jgi:serine protease
MNNRFTRYVAVLLTVLLQYPNAMAGIGDQQKNTTPVFRLPANVTDHDYEKGVVILKVKTQFRSQCLDNEIGIAEFQEILGELGATSLAKIFPNHAPPEREMNEWGASLADLSLIYQLDYSAEVLIEKAVNRILATGYFEYAEPRYIHYTSFTPNDPNLGNAGQYFLTKVQAFAAWDISKGDTNIVIGIVDSGTDWDHPDLINNIKYNYADPINGLDDDNDGFIDNYRGWDVSDKDNNPMVGNSSHGSHVSGCAAASTDNGVGVASTGFLCKFLPVKSSKNSSTTTIDNGYEGITYAADHGVHIINCSWGSSGGGQFGQDVITYATINKNVLIVASAGNDNNEVKKYPASYEYVLNIGSTNTSDVKSSFSSYGPTIDVCAPGSSIYSTYFNNTYSTQSGTSMASPVAAGCAGIVKAHFPTYNALQVAEKLRVTADNIYGISGNSAFINKLGKGRINLLRALTINSPSVRMSNLAFTDNNDNSFVANDTVRVSGVIRNYLAPTSNLTVTLSTTSSFVTVLNGTLPLGVLGTMDSVKNNLNPFQIKINPTAPLNSRILFLLTFTDGTYTDVQMFDLIVNVDYINVYVNEIGISITSKGRIAYNGTGQAEGIGITYKGGASLTYENGLMIGNTSTQVSDNVRGATSGSTDEDFQSVLAVQKVIPSIKSEFDLFGKFNDNPAGATKLSVLVDHYFYAWSTPVDRKFVIVEYVIKNAGTASLNSLYAGIFSDWDIMDYAKNKAAVDVPGKMGYCWSTEVNGFYAGVKLLTSGPFTSYAIDNISGGAGGINMFDGYSTAEKYQSLTSNRLNAGGAGTGNDVIQIVGTGPFSLVPGDSVKVAFAIMAGDSLTDLLDAGIAADIRYNLITGLTPSNVGPKSELYQNKPNPGSAFTEISFEIEKGDYIDLTLYSITGQPVLKIASGYHVQGKHMLKVDLSNLPSGVYFYNMQSGNFNKTRKLIINR